MSNLLLDEVLDLAVIDRAASADLYEYNAAIRDELCDEPAAVSTGTLEHHPHLTEFVD